VRFSLLISILIATLAAASCGSPPAKRPPAKRGSSHSSSASSHSTPRSTAPSARTVLRLYLEATFTGRHGQAWGNLTRADKAEIPRATYVERETANARIRERLGALGKVSYHILRVQARGDRAIAAVRIQTPLGVSVEQFVLRREEERWRVAYTDSWTDTN
jgi:hypothetical protein